MFDVPFAFDVARGLDHHLAFGFGMDYCLATAPARMKMSCDSEP
jgi:cytochrome P450